MSQYLASNGQPFSDPDAAAHKASRMAVESGDEFEVVPVDGGYAVVAQSSVGDMPRPVDTSAPLLADPVPVGEQRFIIAIRPAWRAQISGFFLMFVGTGLAIAPTWPIAIFSVEAMYQLNDRLPGIWDNIQLAGLLFALMGIIMTVWRRYWQKSVVTNTSVMQSIGVLFLNSVSQINLSDVHVVDVKRPNFAHMLLNLGTVELSTPGSSGADVAIVDVVAPKKLAAYLNERVAICKAQRGVAINHQ